MDLPGWKGGEHKVKGVEECRTLCQKHDEAVMFTWRENGNCWCKKEEGFREMPAEGAHSGTVFYRAKEINDFNRFH